MSDESPSADPIQALQAQLVAARRAQILDAATRVFAEKGFTRATIRDVARAAGIADGTIYNYFANKDDLLIGLLDRLNDTARRPASLAQASQAPLAGSIRAYMRERVEALWPNADLFRAVLPELLANPDLRKRYYDEVIAPTMALGEGAFTALMAGGVLRELDPPLSMRIVAGSLLGVLVLQLLGDETLAARWREIPDVLADLLLPGLLADAPKGEDSH
ncbi:MAG TPA: TetR/AcrR family transcriptional regulator [Ktedonobacterales bacterium]|jgi:AcrR family transcriptional regulator|nr:TetR/AcrR family transcriptional regulator [Ktedonobacterales bacterium]